MAYFGGSVANSGDPGFFDAIKRIGRGALGFATGGVMGGIAGLAARPQQRFQVPTVGGGRIGPITRGRVAAQALVPGGVEPFRRKRRRMNPMNKKALTRANRRIDGFVRETKKVLKHTNYKLVSKSAGTRRARRDLGSGHTHVR